jgi:hypothetical protein
MMFHLSIREETAESITYRRTAKVCSTEHLVDAIARGYEVTVLRWAIAPNGLERDIYLVLDDFGHLGRAWRETDEAGTNRATLVRNLLEGQYENPVLIVAFNTAEGWSRDVTLDIADELRRSYPEFDEVPASVLRFLETTNRH